MEAWEALRNHLGVGTNTEVMDALDVDLRWIALSFIGPAERSAVPLGSEGTDFWGCRIRKVETEFNTYYEWEGHPLAHCKTVADVEAYDWPSLDWWDYSAVPKLIEEQNVAGRRAIAFMAGGAFETPWYMRGLEQFLMDLRTQPEVAEAISRRVETYYRERALRVLDAAGGQIDMIGSGGDVGTQRGMMLNPNLWRRHIKPQTGRLIRSFKDLGLKTFRLSFHGGIDEQDLLPHGTPEQVYRETTRIIDVLGRNGGYIVTAAHALQGDTPVENVLAMFDAARDYRWQ
ncbi:MAG: hypothetical protein CVU38_10485 [Chloroflexi bacterium HGW-Chloroflexi-1]|nr:MAG: hypothetical protein CVU38_10485 [Chloroflexi bacterium HGW-Chloroflexi-1]